LHAILRGSLINVANRVMGFFGVIHKRDPNLPKSGLKLRQNRLTEVLGSDASSI